MEAAILAVCVSAFLITSVGLINYFGARFEAEDKVKDEDNELS